MSRRTTLSSTNAPAPGAIDHPGERPPADAFAEYPRADGVALPLDRREGALRSEGGFALTPRFQGSGKYALLAGAVALLAGASFAAYQNRAPLAAWLGLGPATNAIIVSGNIEAHESLLSFKTIQSRIVELPFDEGQWVKAGTVIARVDDADYREQLAMSEAALEVRRRELAATEQGLVAATKTVASDQADLEQKRSDAQRDDTLAKQGFVSTTVREQAATVVRQATAALERDQALQRGAERNIDLARANVQSAMEAVKLAQIVLGYTTLTSPFDGVVLVRQAELGEAVAPGTPVVTLADLDHVWLRAYINEPDIGKVRHGQEAVVTTDTYPGKSYRGRISFIAETAEFTPKSVETHAERVTLVYRIRIDIDNPAHELVPGMPADAQLQALAPAP
jgi:HlyD family secretion protein